MIRYNFDSIVQLKIQINYLICVQNSDNKETISDEDLIRFINSQKSAVITETMSNLWPSDIDLTLVRQFDPLLTQNMDATPTKIDIPIINAKFANIESNSLAAEIPTAQPDSISKPIIETMSSIVETTMRSVDGTESNTAVDSNSTLGGPPQQILHVHENEIEMLNANTITPTSTIEIPKSNRLIDLEKMKLARLSNEIVDIYDLLRNNAIEMNNHINWNLMENQLILKGFHEYPNETLHQLHQIVHNFFNDIMRLQNVNFVARRIGNRHLNRFKFNGAPRFIKIKLFDSFDYGRIMGSRRNIPSNLRLRVDRVSTHRQIKLQGIIGALEKWIVKTGRSCKNFDHYLITEYEVIFSQNSYRILIMLRNNYCTP